MGEVGEAAVAPPPQAEMWAASLCAKQHRLLQSSSTSSNDASWRSCAFMTVRNGSEIQSLSETGLALSV